ncbi:hypothetical protein L1887_51361 [Cichorium endivia]|nr:hypothetical protein L1887_51361 [Cichorium endivia]
MHDQTRHHQSDGLRPGSRRRRLERKTLTSEKKEEKEIKLPFSELRALAARPSKRHTTNTEPCLKRNNAKWRLGAALRTRLGRHRAIFALPLGRRVYYQALCFFPRPSWMARTVFVQDDLQVSAAGTGLSCRKLPYQGCISASGPERQEIDSKAGSVKATCGRHVPVAAAPAVCILSDSKCTFPTPA